MMKTKLNKFQCYYNKITVIYAIPLMEILKII